jgi:hypothetical protein
MKGLAFCTLKKCPMHTKKCVHSKYSWSALMCTPTWSTTVHFRVSWSAPKRRKTWWFWSAVVRQWKLSGFSFSTLEIWNTNWNSWYLVKWCRIGSQKWIWKKKQSSKICEKWQIKLICFKSFDIHFGGVGVLRERKIGKLKELS